MFKGTGARTVSRGVCLLTNLILDNGEAVFMDNSEYFWHVGKVHPQCCSKIKQQLKDFNITSFLPLKKQVIVKNNEELVKYVPVVLNYVFIYAPYTICMQLVSEHNLRISYITDIVTKKFMTIPQKQMEDFMFLCNYLEKDAYLTCEDLKKGDLVRVTDGQFKGIEGELVRMKGHKRIVVRLKGLFSLVTTYVPSTYLEKI